MSNYWKFFSVTKNTLLMFIVGVAFSAGLAYATNPTNPFVPSDRILDPDCVPTDTETTTPTDADPIGEEAPTISEESTQDTSEEVPVDTEPVAIPPALDLSETL